MGFHSVNQLRKEASKTGRSVSRISSNMLQPFTINFVSSLFGDFTFHSDLYVKSFVPNDLPIDTTISKQPRPGRVHFRAHHSAIVGLHAHPKLETKLPILLSSKNHWTVLQYNSRGRSPESLPKGSSIATARSSTFEILSFNLSGQI